MKVKLLAAGILFTLPFWACAKDVTIPLFRHFYIWTSKRIDVYSTTNNNMRLMR